MHGNLEASNESRAISSNDNKRNIKDKASVMNVVQGMDYDIRKNLAVVKDRTDEHVQAAEQIREYNVVKNEVEKIHINKDEAVLLLSEHPKLDAAEQIREYNVVKNEVEKIHIIKDEAVLLLSEHPKLDAAEQIREYNVVKNEVEKIHINKDEAVLLLSEHPKLDAGSTESVLEGDTVTKKRKRPEGSEMKLKTGSVLHLSSSGVYEEQCSLEGLGKYPKISRLIPIKRKLIVLDVNGLLAHIIMPAPKDRRADTRILGRAIFKRPFCDYFLNFCFQNFDVGIWSSRSKALVDKVADYLLGDRKGRILFCWNMSQATQTGFQTLENRNKPLVFKELRKIWENNDPDSCWKNGDYDESNTLLLDDSPYKALLNPMHTAIFPSSYHYRDVRDNSIGPGGDLRLYLEWLLESDSVPKYVEQNPFGQCALNERNPSWEYYSTVLQTMNQPTSSLHPNAPCYN